jgi:trehalose monomycolate/heme transporter
VRRVDSLVTILGPEVDKAGYQAFYAQGLSDLRSMMVRGQFSQNDYTVLSVVYNADPLSKEAEHLVGQLRAVPGPAGAEVYVGGTTATVVDFLDSLEQHVPIAIGLIIGVIFILLFLMLGSLLVPLKAVLLNLLSLSASFGALVWIFQDGHLADLLGFTPLGYVDATEPVLIFAIAFGMSMDYEVFLLSRIKEQYDRTGDMTSSVAIGVQKTGRIITSAALLLGVVIGAFATGKIISIKQVGLGLSLAILLDATLVRMFLVPATMRLLGSYNWWAPAPLAALYRRLGMGEVEHDEPVEQRVEVPVA